MSIMRVSENCWKGVVKNDQYFLATYLRGVLRVQVGNDTFSVRLGGSFDNSLTDWEFMEVMQEHGLDKEVSL